VDEILRYLVQYCSFLWDGSYRITDSVAAPQNFGNGGLSISSDRLRMRFSRERGAQLFLHLQEPDPKKPSEWYSIDLIRRLLTGERQTSSVLDADYAEFLRENIREIEARFSDAAWDDTRKRLVQLKRIRSKEMWG
jgi:hypothetical protein